MRAAAGISEPEHFRGKKIATPQFGNTQDVSCRAWLAEQGFQITQTGGDVLVVPTANPDQLALFQNGSLDAAWTVEPWVARLEREGGGKVLVEEPDALTTVFAASAVLVDQRNEVAQRILAAHRELTAWIAAHPAEAQQLVVEELQRLTGRPIAPDLVATCWQRLRFGDAVEVGEFEEFVTKARAAGFVKGDTDLSRLVRTP